MDAFVDIALLPDPEFPATTLLNALFSKFHRGLVGLEAVQRQLVFFGVDRDGCDPEFGRGAKNSDRNFRPVGNEKATDHGSLFG